MITEQEYKAIQDRMKQGQMPTPEEMQELVEYTKASTLAYLRDSGTEITCPHCGAKVAPGTEMCEYCGANAFMDTVNNFAKQHEQL